MTMPLPRRILVVPLRYIGDTILTVPLIRNLARRLPEADIDVLASRAAAPLLEPCPYIANVLTEPKGFHNQLRLIKKGNYDAVFILRKSFTMALLCRLAGVKTVAGYDKQRFPWGYRRWGLLLDKSVRYPSLKTDTPQAISHLQHLEALGLSATDDHLELWTTPDDRARIDALLSDRGIAAGDRLAVLNAVSASHGKEIDMEKFTGAVRLLLAGGYHVLCAGMDNDRAAYESLAAQLDHPARLLNLAGQTTLRELATLFQRTDVLVTVDSSPVHIGAAAGVPKIVGVFGPTNEKQWGAHSASADFRPVFIDLPCRPCYAKVCSHNNCRVMLTDDQIAGAVHDLADTPV